MMFEGERTMLGFHNEFYDARASRARVPHRRRSSGGGVPDFFAWLEEPGTAGLELGSASGAPNSEHVLLVEDDPVLRRHGALFLQALGYEVEACADGFAALEATLHYPYRRFDLLFTDLSMPGMDGRVLASRLKTLRPSIKVLFTSGHPKESLFSRASERESVLFLPKPYSASDLATMLRQVLDG
jgi:CheY-like chemotaxis protein